MEKVSFDINCFNQNEDVTIEAHTKVLLNTVKWFAHRTSDRYFYSNNLALYHWVTLAVIYTLNYLAMKFFDKVRIKIFSFFKKKIGNLKIF